MKTLTISNTDKLLLLDDSDYERLKDGFWFLGKCGYVYRLKREPIFTVHRLVLGKAPYLLVTDHIDGDKLNNQRANLRFITRQENAINNVTSKGATYGIHKRKQGTFQVTIRRDYYLKYLGTYDTVEEARVARDVYLNTL